MTWTACLGEGTALSSCSMNARYRVTSLFLFWPILSIHSACHRDDCGQDTTPALRGIWDRKLSVFHRLPLSFSNPGPERNPTASPWPALFLTHIPLSFCLLFSPGSYVPSPGCPLSANYLLLFRILSSSSPTLTLSPWVCPRLVCALRLLFPPPSALFLPSVAHRPPSGFPTGSTHSP